MSLLSGTVIVVGASGLVWFCSYIWRIAALPVCPNCWSADCEASGNEGMVRCNKCGWEFLKGKAEL